MNLLEDKWIPVRKKSGRQEQIAPYQLTAHDDPVLELCAPRPDFNGALAQFLIALLQTAAAPLDENEWIDWLEEPPLPEELREKFAPFLHAFELDGDGPRFMQDFDNFTAKKNNSMVELLIDAPGENAIKKNCDHFSKRGAITGLCRSCTALALFTLQLNAPSGGQGHRTSLRGGGPLTTLVVLDPKGSQLEETLWRNIWLNILENKIISGLTGNSNRQQHTDTFPWLTHTRTSENKTGLDTTPMDAGPLQMYWGMPRRIQILWEHTAAGKCDLCGAESISIVTSYKTKNYGINYVGAWQHPLSPYILNKDGDILPVHAQPGGMTYRHWLGLVEKTDHITAALVVRCFEKLAQKYGEQFRVHAFGYDMDNMKARCWYESTFPLVMVPESIRLSFTARVQTLTTTAIEVADGTKKCIKKAWFKRSGDAKGDTSFLERIFFQQTERFFYKAVRKLITSLGNGQDIEILREWHVTLRRAAFSLFDYWAERGDISQADPGKIAEARSRLLKFLNGKKLCEQLHVKPGKEKRA